MRMKNVTFRIIGFCFGIALIMPALTAHYAYAADTSDVKDAVKHIIKAGKQHINKADAERTEFVEKRKSKRAPYAITEKLNLESDQEAQDKKYKEYSARFTADENLKNKILKRIPYQNEAKYAWEVIDGDVDLYFTGLRADRGNKGIEYTTNSLPFMGDVNGFELKFEAGENNKISFKSDVLPFIGRMEGLSFKGATGEEGSHISARYTIALD